MAADRELVALLTESRRVLVFTGAGISTPSGIPDYRGPQGLWKKEKPVYYQDFMSSDAARREYWRQKAEGWTSFRDAEPNAVHRAVVDLERAGALHMCVTQNIDGLHAKAGTSRERLVEIHGTNREVECQSCGDRSDPDPWFAAFHDTGEPPVCACGGWLKPATISFGQALRDADMRRAMQAAESCDLAIALGSTLGVYPAAGVVVAAAQLGVPYVIINRGPTDHDALGIAKLRLEGDVIEHFVPAVEEALAAR